MTRHAIRAQLDVRRSTVCGGPDGAGGSCEDRDIAFTHGLYGTGLPGERRLLFRETEHGLEPLAVWLTPAGMPKKLQG